jgi:hypothetical protein
VDTAPIGIEKVTDVSEEVLTVFFTFDITKNYLWEVYM